MQILSYYTINGFSSIMLEASVPIFPPYSYSDISGMTGGIVLILVMTACGSFTFNWVLTVKAYDSEHGTIIGTIIVRIIVQCSEPIIILSI